MYILNSKANSLKHHYCYVMTKSETNELSMAASYCRLYRSIINPCPPPRSPGEEEQEPPSNDFWQHDTWTDEDYQSAEALLQANVSRSTLPQHRVDRHVQNSKDWDSFYSRNQTKFYNDRHYLQREFPRDFDTAEHRTLVEIGAGVGNNILPLMEAKPTWDIRGFDLSPVAIDLLRRDQRFLQARARADVWDITSMDHPPPVQGIADICTLLFCLSAIHPAHMARAVRNVASTLKPGGILLFRDYGRYDEAQLKLGTARGQRLADNFYVKQDGTKCYYFTLDDLQTLCDNADLKVLDLQYIKRVYWNRAQDQQRRRVWVQGRFQKL
jgi:SAM-dependent methyltransferase